MQNYVYPSSSDVTLTGTPNGAPIPTTSILVAGENSSGNQEPLQLDSNGALIVSPLTTSSVVTANQGAANTLANAWPVKLTDGTNVNSFTANGLKVDGSAVTQPISAASLPLPTGAATSALQTTISGQLPASLGQKTSALSLAVVIASDQSALPISATSLPLPTGAATSALQSSVQGSASGGTAATSSQLIGGVYNSSAPTLTNGQQASNQLDVNGNLKVNVVSGGGSNASVSATGSSVPASATYLGANLSGNLTGLTLTANGLKVDGSAVTQPISAASLPLPTGAATSALQTTISGQLPASLGQKASAASLAVVIASDQSTLPVSSTSTGTASANAPVYNVYSSTNITTSAYVQLVASTANAINVVHIFDSSGQAMIFSVGGSGSEVIQVYVPPGGDTFSLHIPSGSRIAYKALIANATSGYLLMSFLE